MREYFSIISQQSARSTVIPFVVFFHNGHNSGLRWVDLINTPFDELIAQYLSDSQKANALDHIQAYQELDKMHQRIFDEKIFKYQKPSELEMSPTQKLVFESKIEGKIEGKITAKQETLLKYLNKYYQPTAQQQELISSIKDEFLLESLLDEVVEHQKSLDEILAMFLTH